MGKINEHIDYLIIQYSRGTIDSKGTDELLSWLENDPKNKTYFKEQLALLRNVQTPVTRFNTQKGLSEFHKLAGNTHHLALKIAAIAASIALILITGKVLIDRSSNGHHKLIEYTARKEILLRTLNDSTEITLGKNSVLLVPKKFTSETRNVELIGKAFFEVAKDKTRPFIVNCLNIQIKVVGTSFEVEMDTINNLVTVSVARGEVFINQIESDFEKAVYKGNQITVSQTGRLINESEINNENYLSWKTGVLIFENVRMSEVARELTKLYGKKIIFKNDSLQNEFITLKTNNQSLSEVKKTLEIILQAKIDENNDTLIISKNY